MKNLAIEKNKPSRKKFFKNIFGNMLAGGIFIDRTRVIRDCNRAVERIFGYSRKELIGKKTDILYSDRREDRRNKSEIRDRISAHGYHMGRAEGFRKNGDRISLHLYTFVVKENTGAAIIIEEPKGLAQDTAYDLMQLLQTLMDNIPDTIYFKDEKSRLVMVNRALAEGLGLNVSEVIGKTDFDLFPGQDAKRYFADDAIVMKTGKPIVDKIEKSYRPDGSAQYVSTTKTPRYDVNGKIVGTIGITRDVTKRIADETELRMLKERLEEKVRERTSELEESQKKLLSMYNMKTEFINTLSHELRTPLTIIKEGVGIVLDGTTGEVNEQQKRFLGAAIENIDRLSRLINDVLDLSKLEGRKMKFRAVKGNVNEVIENVIRSYEPLIEKKGLKLYKDTNPFLPLVTFDSDRLAQVFYNLITNAIKFTESGSISVGSRKRGDSVEIMVKDTGRGIQKKDIPRLFQKFEQINPEDGSKNKGTGLGLAISKQIIEQLGGKIWVESQYGEGTSFIFTLPIK